MLTASEANKLSRKTKSYSYNTELSNLSEKIEKNIIRDISRKMFHTYVEFYCRGISYLELEEFMDKYKVLGYKTKIVYDYTDGSFQIRLNWSINEQT